MYKTKITDSLSRNLTNNVHVLITPALATLLPCMLVFSYAVGHS